MDNLAALLQRNDTRWTPQRERTDAAGVIAVLQLREAGRKWLVVGFEERDGERLLVGYEPRCRYDMQGDGWFSLHSDFFLTAARVTDDQLDVHTVASFVTVAELDVDDRF